MQEKNPLYRLNVFPFALDWSAKYKNQQILKCFFAQFPSKNNNDQNMFLIVQQQARIVVYNLNNSQGKSFVTQSCVPMLLQHPEEGGD